MYEQKTGRRKQECERLGLEWPRLAAKQCRRRPKFETLYKEELYKLMWDNSFPTTATSTMPVGWVFGRPIVSDIKGVLALVREEGAAFEEAEVEVLEDDAEDRVDEGAEPILRKKQKKVTVEQAVKDWFIEFHNLQYQSKGWALTQSSAEAVSLAPSLFAE
eukprot:2395797-Amphidinium_carterae.1